MVWGFGGGLIWWFEVLVDASDGGEVLLEA